MSSTASFEALTPTSFLLRSGKVYADRVAVIDGAPPTPAILQRVAELGMDVTHLYGLTETFGPVAICEWRGEWSKLAIDEQALIKARQGIDEERILS